MYLVFILSVFVGWVGGSRKIFSLNLYQAKSAVISFGVGGLNLRQAKFDVFQRVWYITN